MSKALNVLQRVGAALSIAEIGGPTMSTVMALAAGFCVVLGHFSLLSAALALLSVFATVLWCFIGICWLKDRADRSRLKPVFPDPYAWGLVLANFLFMRDETNLDAEWQLKAEVFNKVGSAVRLQVVEFWSTVDNITTQEKALSNNPPIVLVKDGLIAINSAPYKAGMLPECSSMSGKMTLKIKYGHPDIGYSRYLEKELDLTCLLANPDQSSGVVVPLVEVISESDYAISTTGLLSPSVTS